MTGIFQVRDVFERV